MAWQGSAMSVDPLDSDPLGSMLDEISRTLKDNQKFLKALKDERLADEDLEPDDVAATGAEDEYEEL